ncbi:MAG TPA: hypothetical protein VF495_13985 [Phenylobacterium sp.]|jgi:hypothetical protein
MAHTPAWKSFKRTQDLTVAMASLIYAGAVVHAFARLPWTQTVITQRTLLFPAAYLVLSLAVPLAVGALRRGLSRYVWMSYQAGFGQTLFSIVSGVVLLGGAAGFMYWQISRAVPGGLYPAGVFSAYGAGIGILAAQATLVRVLEKDVEVRKVIETPPPE